VYGFYEEGKYFKDTEEFLVFLKQEIEKRKAESKTIEIHSLDERRVY